MKTELTVVILTYNEEIHIERCINNVIGWAANVFILDSFSTDETTELALKSGAEVFYRRFDDYSSQRNFAIKELPVKTEWMLFLDADEYLTEALKNEITFTLSTNNDISGYYIKRRFYFMNKWIRYGGYYPTWLLRLFKTKMATCEGNVNEHIQVTGKTSNLKNDFIDDNKKGFSSWIDKHNNYSTMEAEQLFQLKMQAMQKGIKIGKEQAQRKHWVKLVLWNRLPVLVRPMIYFLYRYFLRLGFLDGRKGFIYHFMQGYVFWMWVDIKYLELKSMMKIDSDHEKRI
jgi:glycosyltransferase involved in cell wall biosynthesis